MPIQVLMPALSPTMEKGNLAKWLKREGDKVKSGDVIAEIETDKATMEVEAVDEGTLGKILVPEGTNDVAVNTPIAMILGEGESGDGRSTWRTSSRRSSRKPPSPRRRQLERKSKLRPSPKKLHPPPRPRRSLRRSPSPTCRKAPRWSP